VVSTLKVTKIQIPNSDSDVISLDASSGNITIPKNVTFSDTVTLEGSNNTAVLHKSLAKVTGHLTLAGVSDADASLNISSVADGSTGKNTISVTNAFSSATAAVGNISNHDDSYNRGTGIRDASASQFETFMFQASSGSLSDDDTDHSVTIHGDLA
jgi:hypothetical protein|tara:strand:- start:63 stop:530 length:468 start_codon:yes stop_codon:yes gene_type:complete